MELEKSKNEIIGTFAISIKNLTDEKFYDVSILNPNISKDKIKLTLLTAELDFSYERFLQQIKIKNNTTIGAFKYISTCEYKKFEQRQLFTELCFKQTNISGSSIAERIKVCNYIDPFQQQDNVVIIERETKIMYNSDIILEYLMPETEVIIAFTEIKK